MRMNINGLPDAYSWESVGTVGGCVALTLLTVQLLKAPLDKIARIPTRVFVYIVSFALMLCANVFTGNVGELGNMILIAVNAIPVALSAMGAYELTFAKSDEARRLAEELPFDDEEPVEELRKE